MPDDDFTSREKAEVRRHRKPTLTIPNTRTPPRLSVLPGRAQGFAPLGRWHRRCDLLITKMQVAGADEAFKPYLREAEGWLEEAQKQLAMSSGGMCGPIESNALATAAWQTAYARFWMHKAAEDPTNTRLFETASRLADAARANSLAAYEMAVRLHRNAPQRPDADPLAAYTTSGEAFADEQDDQEG